MDLKNLHQDAKTISTSSLFKTTEGSVTSIQILRGERLKEHITKVPALLICISGEAIFENEEDINYVMSTGNYVNIEPNVKHWITAKSTCNLILIK